jgi:hypothetical protein
VGERKVLLRKDAEGRYREVADVVEQLGGARLRVRWHDGTEEEHIRTREEMTPVAGSFAHLARVYPQVVTNTLSSDPAIIYKQLLKESPRGLKATDLKQKVRSQVDPQLVERSWTVAKRELVEDPLVQASDERMPTYRFAGSSVTGFEALFPSKLGEPPRLEPSPHEEDAVESGPALEDPVTAPEDGVVVEHAAAGSNEDPSRPGLLTRLENLDDELSFNSLGEAARALLAIGRRVGKLSAKDQVSLSKDLSAAEKKILALACGPGKRDVWSGDVQEIEAGTWAAALDACLDEASTARGPDASSLKATLRGVVSSAASACALPADLLVRVASTFARRPTDREGLEQVLDLIAARWRQPDESLEKWDATSLARAARAAWFTRTGGRTGLVAAYYQREPELAARSEWWEGAELEQLADGGRGLLATVLDDPRVGDRIVKPLVQDFLNHAASRSAIATVWTLPPAVAQHVSGERLAELMSVVAQTDSIADIWRRSLSNANTVTRLEEALANSKALARTEQQKHEQLAREVERLRTNLNRAADQLATMRVSESATREQHDRQVRLDLLRALAMVIAQVRQSQGARSDQALMRQLEHTCRREGLERLEDVGLRVSFDPTLHDTLSPGLSPGAPAVVVRNGYTWQAGDDRVVLIKVQVVGDQE